MELETLKHLLDVQKRRVLFDKILDKLRLAEEQEKLEGRVR